MDTQKPRILLIEDDAFLVGMYVTKLDFAHYEPLVANAGEIGLMIAKQQRPDLILLDILLPKMNGFRVLEELKRDPATKDIPVVMLTNLGQEQDMARGLRLGAADYLVKVDYEPTEVIEKIRRLLGR